MLSGKNIFHRRKEVPSSVPVMRELDITEAVYLERKVDENFVELGIAIEEMSVLVGALCIVTSFCLGYVIWELITKGGE